MIPRTYPSKPDTVTGESQMVVYFLPDVTGLTRWIDYIPMRVSGLDLGLQGNNYSTFIYTVGLSAVEAAASKKWIDYIPVYEDLNASDEWQVSATGFIPFSTTTGGDGSNHLLTEAGDNLLTEGGDYISLEGLIVRRFLTENLNNLVAEDNSFIILE